MKIGIITFHWAANHGAILQTYATMYYLEKLGADVFVIDYCPNNLEITYKNAMRITRPKVLIDKVKQIKKNKALSPFRQKLHLSRRYRSNDELIQNPPEADIYIAGSDQIWNPYFLMHGENKLTPTYFLNFGKSSVKKVGMSVSFGCTEYPEEEKKYIIPLIKDFEKISVREQSGLSILESMSFDKGCVVADPTSLLDRRIYLDLCKMVEKQSNIVTTCILRRQSEENKKKIKKVIDAFHGIKVNDITNATMEKWLSGIRDAECVVTNSFHCVMLCLKLHTPFIVILEDGNRKGMNDRLFTLLSFFDLKNRIYDQNWEKKEEINWSQIDSLMETYSMSLKRFLDLM